MGENHQSRKYNKQIMSQANAAARKRRAGGSSMPGAPEPMVQQQPPAGAGLTLPQVIALVDKRLVNLETFMKETKASVPKPSVPLPSVPQPSAPAPSAEMDDALVEEINTKFELLATEVAELKDMIVKLQSFTMEVNKKMFEERIQLLSDVGDNGPMKFDMKRGDNLVLELSEDDEA
jgi:hypothetical protein